MNIKGIDISKHNGNIDFGKVKDAGIKFVIIRSSYGWFNEDSKFKTNVKGCEKVGLEYGLYHYSYARNLGEAATEAKGLIKLAKSCNPTYPIVVDMEDADGYKKRNNVSNEMCIKICEYICNELEKAGFYAMIYANLDWLNNRIDDNRLNKFDKWVAQWSSKCTYDKEYGIWQYTSDGKVNGISGRVDMNECYKDYPAIIKNLKGNKDTEEKKTEVKKEEVENVENNVENFITYKIKAGDTLGEIAEKYNTTVDYLVEINNIKDKNKIYAGDTIKVPGSAKQTKEIKIGSKVKYAGYLYKDSFGNGKGKYVNGTYTVTTYIKSREYGINVNSGLGWIKVKDCKLV